MRDIPPIRFENRQINDLLEASQSITEIRFINEIISDHMFQCAFKTILEPSTDISIVKDDVRRVSLLHKVLTHRRFQMTKENIQLFYRALIQSPIDKIDCFYLKEFRKSLNDINLDGDHWYIVLKMRHWVDKHPIWTQTGEFFQNYLNF